MMKFNPDIVLYGGPGSGKSTQALSLAEKLHAQHLNMGGLLRKFAKGKSADALVLRKAINAGKLAPVQITNGLAQKFVRQADINRPIVFDGYPRNMAQVRFLDRLLVCAKRQVRIVFITLSMTVARQRLLKRAKIEHRMDDLDPKALTARIKVFQREAKNLSAHYRRSGRFTAIHGNQTVKQVQDAIYKAVSKC